MRQLKVTSSITMRTDNLALYTNEIKKLSTITPEKEVELAQRIKNGDEKAVQELVNANLRFVISVAKQYSSYCITGITLDDLIQEGNSGLIKAATMFDETRGFKFISYAVWWIRQSIQQFIADNNNDVARLPSNIYGLRSKIFQINEKYLQLEQREATEEEILENLNEVQRKNYTNFIKRGNNFPEKSFSLQSRQTDESNDTYETSILVNNDNIQPECNYAASGGKFTEILLSAIKKVQKKNAERSYRILLAAYGIREDGSRGEEEDLAEIAIKEGLTRERVRQIILKTITDLKKLAKLGELSINLF